MPAVKTPADIMLEISRYYQKKRKPSKEYAITYDSSAETLEPVYFWILDFMNNIMGDVEKLTDNFTSSPGSGHFSELMAKGTRMQEEAMKIMQTSGILIKSLVQIIYDLRNFEIRLQNYKDLKSDDKAKAEAALLSLKQIWLDKVDIQKGNTSIKAMAFSQAAFATLIDAFMIIKSVNDVKKIDLNDRVKRILEQRILEFNKWRELSEKELYKRYNIEKSWLKNQVNSLKLYTRWAKPYLKAAEELMMTESKDAALVKAFNTIRMELTLLGKKEIKIKEEAENFDLPEDFKNIKFKRKYYACILVDFKFRGIPQKAGQHYVFGGRSDISFKAYALNEEELALMKKKLEESDVNEALKMVEIATTESLGEIKDDLEYFLKDESERKIEEYQAEAEKDVNPFAALLGFGAKKPKPAESMETAESEGKKIKDIAEIKKDNYAESVVRKYAESKAENACYTIYDVYKKAHGMASTRGKI